MNRRELIRKVKDISISIAEKLDMELVDIEYVKEFGSNFLRVYIDKAGGVTVDDCQAMSEKLSKVIDQLDPIKEHYYLEVSSPGLDRPLKTDRDLQRNIGKEIEIGLYKTFLGKKKFDGYLKGYSGKEISIISGSEDINIPREYISIVKLKVNF